jgi:hypothetical protein
MQEAALMYWKPYYEKKRNYQNFPALPLSSKKVRERRPLIISLLKCIAEESLQLLLPGAFKSLRGEKRKSR